VVRPRVLRRHVNLVEAEMARAHIERDDGLARHESLPRRNDDLDHEEAGRVQMPRNIEEALDLRVLRCQVHDRVSHQVREGERAIHLRG
jgi:hypothetical protein